MRAMALRWDIEDGRVAVITLDEPDARNALTSDARSRLRAALVALRDDPLVDVAVITGAEGNFCAGGDVRTMGESDPKAIAARMADVAETAEMLAAFPKPVICAVAGHAAGAGISLACLADMVIAEESAKFTFSFLRLALGPDWGLSFTLARRVGATIAKQLILSAAAIDGNEAHRLGLADVVTHDSEALHTALGTARALAGGPKAARAAVKAMLGDLDGLRAALAAEAEMQGDRFPHPEHQEAARAFREKRKADFTGRDFTENDD
ncbi:MAG: enoyl-CoA hydratase/isomerase family protein [Alphaproteobacteria bacterium]|nr:MAG: enoyl-CoA hydratase/isomerase family protein [Alphaproteobacteria bacterium]